MRLGGCQRVWEISEIERNLCELHALKSIFLNDSFIPDQLFPVVQNLAKGTQVKQKSNVLGWDLSCQCKRISVLSYTLSQNVVKRSITVELCFEVIRTIVVISMLLIN